MSACWALASCAPVAVRRYDGAKMLLTVAMIARDEESRIGASIASAKCLADHIVVVDSGSKDNTVAIAQAAGAKVVHHPWNDDFSAARNAAIPHLKGRWTFWLDADEFVDASSVPNFRHLLSRNDASGFGVIRRDYVNGFEPGEPAGASVSSMIFRVLRNDLGFRFTGRCHEQPCPFPDDLERETGLKVFASPLTLDHDCRYYYEGRIQKALRNGRLLDMEIRERPGRLYWMIQCGATLLDVPGMADRGKEVMAQSLHQIAAMHDQPRAPMALVELALEYAVNTPAAENLPLSPQQAYDLAQKWFPDAVPVIWMRAKRAYDVGDFEGAIPILRRLIDIGERRAYNLEVPFDQAVVGDDARLNLGVCLLRTAQLDESERIFRQINPTGPRGEEARMNLNVVESLREKFAR